MAAKLQAALQKPDELGQAGDASDLFAADTASTRSTRAASQAFADLGEDDADFVVPAQQRPSKQSISTASEPPDSRPPATPAIEPEESADEELEISNTNPSGKFFENAGHPDDTVVVVAQKSACSSQTRGGSQPHPQQQQQQQQQQHEVQDEKPTEEFWIGCEKFWMGDSDGDLRTDLCEAGSSSDDDTPRVESNPTASNLRPAFLRACRPVARRNNFKLGQHLQVAREGAQPKQEDPRADMSFPVAPKRSKKGARPLGERGSAHAELESPPQAQDTSCAQDKAGALEEEIMRTAWRLEEEKPDPDKVQRAPIWQPRRYRSKEHLQQQAAVLPQVSRVPAWAQWGGANASATHAGGACRIGGDGQDGADDWACPPGVAFDWICIGFEEVQLARATEDTAEVSTCDGGGEVDEAYTSDDLDDIQAEVIRGYSENVVEGHGFPVIEEPRVNSHAKRDEELLQDALQPAAWGDLFYQGGSSWQQQQQSLPEPTAPVTHIVFVVHGMGATEEGLEQNVRDLRESLEKMREHWFWHTDVQVHVEMIDWKCTLQSTQTSIFERITPAEARGFRMSLNCTLSDVIFYKTPFYRDRIHEIVVTKMNSRVQALRAHPSGRYSDARIAVIGHSLGSVISYDVLSGFAQDTGAPPLEFEVDSYFLWGSPLAAFMSIDDADQQRGSFTLPPSIRLYNIFHPQDPVAFRLEPVYYPDQDQIAPEMIPYWVNNGVRSSKQWARSYEYAKSVAHQKWMTFKSSLWQTIGTSQQVDKTRKEWESYLHSKEDDVADWPGWLGASSSMDEAVDEENALKPKTTRLDFVLQEHAVETYVEHLGLLQSHFCYWTSYDVALFMLCKMSQQETAHVSQPERDKVAQAEVIVAAAVAGQSGSTEQRMGGDSSTFHFLSQLEPAEIMRHLGGSITCVARAERVASSISEGSWPAGPSV